VVFGKLEKPALMHLPDMTPRELATLLPLILLTVFFGAYPAPILDIFGPTVETIIKPLTEAAAAAEALATASLQ
jgi:NADH-quinone oxidoreductase subunit M